jgi:hypothetical protein
MQLRFAFVFLSLLTLSSCSVSKRHYMKGFFVEGRSSHAIAGKISAKKKAGFTVIKNETEIDSTPGIVFFPEARAEKSIEKNTISANYAAVKLKFSNSGIKTGKNIFLSEFICPCETEGCKVAEKELARHPDLGAALAIALLLIALLCPPLINVVCDAGWAMGIFNSIIWAAIIILFLYLFISIWPVWALVLSILLWNLISCILLLIIYNP